jgi:RNA polymerase sigma-70 factor, ECF subfamily
MLGEGFRWRATNTDRGEPVQAMTQPSLASSVSDRIATRTTPRSLAEIVSDEATFRAWYDVVAPRVYAYLVSRCSVASVAEDLTQQTLIAAIRSAATFDGRENAVPWLIGIARHHLAGHYRALEREERRHERMVVHEVAVKAESTEWARWQQRDAVARALRSLPAMQRAVLVLRFFDRLSVREIASEIGRSESATESLLGRARAAFERVYEEPIDAD